MLFVLVTAMLSMQWSVNHIHLAEHHDHDGTHHQHNTEAHAHQSFSHNDDCNLWLFPSRRDRFNSYLFRRWNGLIYQAISLVD